MMQSYFTPSWSRLALAALLTVGGFTAAQAQAFGYPADRAANLTGTYTDLGTTGTAITTANTDDANSTAQSIGFSFTYEGTTYTQFVLNTNGYIKLGATAPAAPYFYAGPQVTTGGPLNSTTEPNLILPFNTDLTAGAAGTEYRVYTAGTTGSRVCTIQWKNVSDKASTIATQYANISFQAKLYEGTNRIEFIYNTATAGTGTSAYRTVAVGLKGNNSTGNQLLTVQKASTQAWSTSGAQNADYPAPAAGFAPTGHNIRTTALPDAGRTYRFDACPASSNVVSTFPYIENFDASTGALTCGTQVVDANSDGYSWYITDEVANSAPNSLVYFYNDDDPSIGGNDWFYTPGLSLRAGYRYQLQFKYAAGDGDYPEALEVKYGTATTTTAQTTTIFSNSNINNDTAYLTTTAGGLASSSVQTITPTANGIYYIGFHVISQPDRLALTIDDIQVTETAILAVRNPVNNVFTAQVAPVPFGSTLNVTLNTLKAGPLHLTMRDALGRVLRQSTTATTVGTSTVAVPEVANLAPGVYFLTVEQGGATQVIRVAHE